MRKSKLFLLKMENDLRDLAITTPEHVYIAIETVRKDLLKYMQKHHKRLYEKWCDYEVN